MEKTELDQTQKEQIKEIKKILEKETGNKAVCLVAKSIYGSLHTEWAITTDAEVKALLNIGDSGIYAIKYMSTWVAGSYNKIDARLRALTH